MWNVGLDANETHSHLGLRLGACHVAALLCCHTVVLAQHIGYIPIDIGKLSRWPSFSLTGCCLYTISPIWVLYADPRPGAP